MDPFTIHCSSCQSRIRVRNPSMIGQIANCPKCGSMIMITAPQQAVTTPQQILVDSRTGSVTDSVAVTKEALPVPDEGLLGDMHPLDQGFDHAFRSEGLPDLAPPESVAFESLSPTSWMPEPTPPPRIDEAAPSVPTPSNSRQIMLIAAIGLCSVLLACGIFFAFLRWYARPTTVASNPTAAHQAAVGGPNIDPSLTPSVNAAEPLDVAAQAAATLDTDKLPSIEPQAQVSSQITDSSTTDQTSEQATENAGESSVNDLGGAPLASTGSSTPNSGIANSGKPGAGDIASGAPLSLQQSVDIDSTFAVPGADASAEAVKEALPPGLQDFGSIFDQAMVPILSDASVPLAAAPDAGDDAPATDVVAAAASPMALVLPETLEQKQATTISGLLIQKRPLAEVLSTLSLTSEIPFTVDLDGLLAAGVDRDQIINFKSAIPVTVLDVLNTLARDYNLSFEPYEKKLFIVRGSASALESRVPASLPVADLVGGAEQSTALSAALSELLPELGDGIQLADGTAQADLEKVNRLLWFQVARLLETWRVARGIENPDTTSLVPKSSLLPGWPVDAAQQLAQKKVSQTLLPEPLAHGWHRLSSEVGMTCWIDWPSLISAQASPSQVSMAISQGRSLQELLQRHANKYQVVFAIEDERTLWVTSPDMHRFQPRLHVLPMAGKTVDEWRKELEPLTPFNPDGTEALKVVAAPDGHFVFIRCCRPVLAEPGL